MGDVKQLDGDAALGLDSLYRRHSDWLARRLRAYVGADEAADVVQETYIRAAPYPGTAIRHPKSFLLRIAVNLIRNEGRRRGRGDRLERDIAAPDHVDAPQIDQVLLKQIVLAMPSLYRDVFVLSRFGGMTYAEIAVSLGLNVKTVEWRMSKALEHCVSQLDV